MHYVQLNNDSVILSTSEGVFTLNRYCFNYNKIVTCLKHNTVEKELLPLLEKPDTPNGVFFAYLDELTNRILIEHRHNNQSTGRYLNKTSSSSLERENIDNMEFLGVYLSEKDICKDYPEYAI
jgi:hypothetical protein